MAMNPLGGQSPINLLLPVVELRLQSQNAPTKAALPYVEMNLPVWPNYF